MAIKAYIGIDFGTTKTSVCQFTIGARQPNLICLQGGATEVPTSIVLDPKTGDTLAWGIDVDSCNNGVVYDLFKLDAGKSEGKTHHYTDGIHEGEVNVAQRYFAEVFSAIRRHFGGQLSHNDYHFIIGCPTDWSKSQKKRFETMIKEIKFDDTKSKHTGLPNVTRVIFDNIELLEEACAVAKYQEWNGGINWGLEHFMVFDFGGATLNMGIFLPHKEGYARIATHGIGTGGKDFDNAILEYFKKNPAFHQKAEENTSGARLHCKRLKEKLSSNIVVEKDGEVSVLWNGSTLSLDKKMFKDICGDLIAKIPDAIEKMLDDANISAEEISKILISGGSSQFYFVREQLHNFFPHLSQDEIIYSANANLVVAQGLAVSTSATPSTTVRPVPKMKGKSHTMQKCRNIYTLGLTGYYRHKIEFDILNKGSTAGNINVKISAVQADQTLSERVTLDFFNIGEIKHYTYQCNANDTNVKFNVETIVP